MRAVALGGGDPVTVVSGESNVSGVAVDDANVHFSNYTDGTIVQVPKPPLP